MSVPHSSKGDYDQSYVSAGSQGERDGRQEEGGVAGTEPLTRRTARMRGGGGLMSKSGDTQTLRERAWREACASDKDWILDLARTLDSCQTLDATAAFSYFWDETPNEETFRMGDLPSVGLPAWLAGEGRASNAVFVESRAPASGLGWSLVLDHRGRSGQTSRSEVMEAAATGGVPTVATNVDPGAMAFDPGLLESAGALIYVDSDPHTAPSRDFYLNFVEAPELDGAWAGVLHFIPFAAFKPGVCGGAVLMPQVLYYIPIGHDGRIRPLDRAESLPMVIPDQEPAAQCAGHESLASILAKGPRPLHLAALFSLVCAGSLGARGAPGEEPAVLEDSLGARRVLQMDAIRAELDIAGRAGSLGLSHALTVCRELLGGFTGPARHTRQAE